jgi:serine/threonine-protein kinase
VIGETVGSYTVTEKISVGGMGTVYKAEHTLIGKPAAVKVLHPELCNNREIVNRFFNEAKATTQIKHPGIVEVFDFGYMESGDAFIVMEFLEGQSLGERITARGALDEGEAAMLLRSVCNALAAAHGKKIVHRDLKPDNIFLVADPEAPTGERPKILDFGIAKLADASLQGPTTVTKTGSVMGTPTYMSPEQCKGLGELDERSDLYSLGCIFYELVTGRPPFTGMSAGELIGAHLYIEPPKPSAVAPAISAQTEQLILSLLAKDPAKRPQSARDLALRFGEIGKEHGWLSHTNPTAMRTPVAPRTSARLETGGDVAPTMAAETPPLPARVPQPTTLSGAASQTNAVQKRRAGMLVAVAGAVLISGAVGFVAVNKLGDKHATQPAAHATEPAPIAAPVVNPPPVEVAKPVPPPVEVAKPAPPPVEAPPPPDEKPPVVAKPAVGATKPAVQVAKHPAAKPATKSVAKPTTAEAKPATTVTKPADTKPAPKPGTGSASGKILIETDL